MDNMYITCQQCTYNNDIDATSCIICGTQFNNNSTAELDIDKQLKLIEKNCDDAYNTIPECFTEVEMLYIPIEINGYKMKAFVDTGAQESIMSMECAVKCCTETLIDCKITGIAHGIGEQTILGRIWMVDVMLEGHYFPCSFTILDKFKLDILIGLDILCAYKCNVDLNKRCLKIGDIEVKFIK